MQASGSTIGVSGALGSCLAVGLGRAGVPIVIGSRAGETARVGEPLSALRTGAPIRDTTHAGIRITGRD